MSSQKIIRTFENAGVLRGESRPDLIRDECLPDIFKETAMRRSGHPAIISNGMKISYSELDTASDVVAAALISNGAGPGRVIGLFMPRGADLLIAQLGISKSGAAWLPFDAETPKERVIKCLQSADASGIVSCRDWLTALSGISVPAFAIENLKDIPHSGKTTPLEKRVKPDDPAYVIYTSGSTGQPKGILVTHRSICHFLRSENDVLGVREDDIAYQGFSVAFDMSFEEIWISYLVGATLWIASADMVGDPDSVAHSLNCHRITVLHTVPTLMGLIEDPLPLIRLINLGGEACPDVLVERLHRPGRELFNTYGPTEATVSASVARLHPEHPVTVGVPLPNYGIAVLDEQMRPLPQGETGEISIFGPGIAIGYLGLPELTAERFISNPFASTYGESRMYLTGDMGRIDCNGHVHCLGRIDSQVKIRGFRVELGEIEAVLVSQPGVSAAAVVMRPLGGIEQLVGFVVPSGDSRLDFSVLQKALSLCLPSYMVPAYIEINDQLPRLTSGKIDRGMLKNISLKASPPASDMERVQPMDEDELALYSALGIFFPNRSFRPQDDFFNDLGGHSLLAARLVSILRKNEKYAGLSVQEVYRGRRLDAICDAMRRQSKCGSGIRSPAGAAVPALRRFLCGVAQAAAIPVLVLIHISTWLAPFFIYHYFTGDEGDSIPVAILYSVTVFVFAQIATFGFAIAGKWLIAGRLKAGRFPLWGFQYFRWWLSDQFSNLPPVYLLSGTPLLCWYLRALGAQIGDDVFIDSVSLRAPDLLSVDSGASIGASVHLGNARIEGGMLIIGNVRIGRDAVIDSCAVLEDGVSIGRESRLGGLSSLSSGRSIPDGEIWEGAPACRVNRVNEPLPPRPRVGRMLKFAQICFFISAGLTVAVMFFMAVFPSFMLIDWIDVQFLGIYENDEGPLEAFVLFFLLGIPSSVLLVTTTALLSAALRRLLIPRQIAGTWSLNSLTYCRKWLLSRVMDSSLGILHGLYASMFAPAWLRMMGAKVGKGSEVSTAVGIVPDLLSLGEYSFIADGVMLGDEEQRSGWMVLRPTSIGNRSFVGNSAYVSDGASVPDDVLIGVQTKTPENSQLKSGQTWIGSPPILLPVRECLTGFNDSLTFNPSILRKSGRAIIEVLRIVLPLAFMIASAYLIIHVVVPIAGEAEWLKMFAALAFTGCLYGFASYFLVVALKWILIGRYRPRAAPMWTSFVWLSEAVTNLYESMAVPNLLEFMRGTPMLPWALGILGADIGKGTFIDTTDMTEFDCVEIGDGAELNSWCGPQTHLFEDRIMKIGMVRIGSHVSVGSASTILYDTQIGERVRLGPLTLVAKGESLPAGTCWEGSPAAPLKMEKRP